MPPATDVNAIDALRQRRPDLFQSPDYWVTRIDQIEAAVARVKKAKAVTIGTTAGQRSVYAFEHGVFEPQSPTTTISSATSCDRPECFFDPAKRARPAVVLVGCIHGGETQGIAVSMDVLNVLETGSDLRGRRRDRLAELLGKVRIVIVPCLNNDGRQRAGVDHLIDADIDDLYLAQQGLDEQGNLIRGRKVKELQPFPPDKHQYLGGYYNDAGINLQHDDFFGPTLAPENTAMRDLMRRELPDGFLTLHAHGAPTSVLAPDAFVPPGYQRRQAELAGYITARLDAVGLPTWHNDTSASPPWTFNFQNFHHHVCGATPLLVELAQGIRRSPQSLEQILDAGLIVVEAWLEFAVRFGLRPVSSHFFPMPVRAE